MFTEVRNGDKVSLDFKDLDKEHQFRQLLLKVAGVYRVTSDDKFKFISGLSRISGAAITGSTDADAPALAASTVGFAMGSGCDISKAQASVLMVKDDFNSIFNAIRWGRNVFDNCRKFIQFQLTVNLSCLWIVLLGAATLGQSPFTILQLLWINLVMDILAAIALATEAPIPGQLRNERVNLKEDSLVSQHMWRSIYIQLFYQMIVMTVLLYFSPQWFGIDYKLVKNFSATADASNNQMQHYTFLFQTFMLMNLFNMVNCRTLPTEDDPQYNIVKHLNGNWWFVIILLFELNVQFLMIGYPNLSGMFVTTPITLGMHLTALGFALGALGVGALSKAIPVENLEFLPKIEEEETENSI